jgi:hypothetical protein
MWAVWITKKTSHRTLGGPACGAVCYVQLLQVLLAGGLQPQQQSSQPA